MLFLHYASIIFTLSSVLAAVLLDELAALD